MSAADDLLRLLLLDYTTYDPADLHRGVALLRADPALAHASVATLAACGRADGLAARLADDPGAVDRPIGPHGWVPLLHVCFSRLGLVAPDLAGDAVATARVLLAAGADPEAGFLWRGCLPPFTALTGALGGGERGEPPHPRARGLAVLLLAAGADPNDGQTLYDRIFTPADDHLDLLLPAGLGRPHPGRWRDRLGERLDTPGALLAEHLAFAAYSGYAARVRRLLAHGADADAPATHPVLGGRTPLELAWRNGWLEAADLLADHGAAGRIEPVDRLVGLALAGDDTGVSAALTQEPGLARSAAAARPEAVTTAGEWHDVRGVDQLLRLGLGIDAHGEDGVTALHRAALRGDEALCRALVERGASRTVRDREHAATPAGWAVWAGHLDLAATLAP